MAEPVVSSVSPSSGLTRGRTFVLILGSDFDTQAIGEGDTEKVKVYFGAREADDVRVQTSGRLTCISPYNEVGVVDVTVTNLGPPEESGVLASSYTYARPDLTVRTNLQVVIEATISWLRRELIANVSRMTSSEYDAATGNEYVEHASLPSIVLIGPEILKDSAHGTTEEETYQDDEDSPTSFETRRAPERLDLYFIIEVASEYDAELISLVNHATVTLTKTDKLWASSPGGEVGSMVGYDLDLMEYFDMSASSPQASNVRSARAKFVVRGVTVIEGETVRSGPVIQDTDTDLVVTAEAIVD